jgi:antitoxin component YwqK of YwqJK toxin-antitoxin module
MRWLVFVCLIISISTSAQLKSYIIGVKGDTLNRVDANGLKQGRWVSHVDALRGEPGYEEEGVYKDGKKEGTWRSYSLEGDLLSIENYKWGYKNGQCQYFNLYGRVREESWKAIDPKNPYDTIDVPDLNTDAVYKRVVKVDAFTVKHGTWNYYDPQTGALVKSEEYLLDQLQDPSKKKTALGNTDSTGVKKDSAITSKAKPKEVLEYEKKNSGKKKIKVRDGATGVQ